MAVDMSPLPSISILVMSYNQEAFIGDCVDSVLSQEYDGELEYIFCDDNSTDSTFSIISEKIRQYTGPRRVVAHKCPTNGRVAVNMNTAVKLSQYDWLMRVDGDDILHPDRTRLTSLAIQKFPDVTAVSGKLIPFSKTYTPFENVNDAELRFRQYSIVDVTDYSIPTGLEWWGCMMTISRRIFTEFGDLPASCYTLDDTMFASRSLMLGRFIIIENGVLLYYRRHAGNISSDANTENLNLFQSMRNDAASRNYYERGILSHKPILDELERYAAIHPDCYQLYTYFKNRFAELKRQAFFWKKSWKERIADAGISGPFWKKIPWAIRVMNPLTYALAAKFMKKS